MSFVSLINVFKYLKSITSTSKKDVMRNIGQVVSWKFLWNKYKKGDYDFRMKFSFIDGQMKQVDQLQFMVMRKVYDHKGFYGTERNIETNFLCKNKDTKPHQVAVFFPARIVYSITSEVLADPNFLNTQEFNRELQSNYENVLLKQPWFTITFKGTNPFVIKNLKVQINMILLCSDSMFCHPNATYWTEELDTSVLVDNKNNRLEYDVVLEGHWNNHQIVCAVKLNNRIIETIRGYPILLYFFDPYYHQDDEYNWGNNVVELQKILNDVEESIDIVQTDIRSFEQKVQIIPTDFPEKNAYIRNWIRNYKKH